MRTRLLFFLCALLFGTTFAFAESLDVALEGPWIYYEDSMFIDGTGKNINVLVLMAPWVPGHGDPIFSTGHGFNFHYGVYCVGFDDKFCAQSVVNTAHLTSGPYPPLQFVHVKSQASWHWYSDIKPNAWYVILPMPDSASNDGVDNMTLDHKFASYTNGERAQSIGIHLHYTDGPKKLKLYECTPSNIDSCPNPQSRGDQDNSGTLRIAIKAPEETAEPAKHCDHHVRAAYHNMVLLLDKKPLESGANTNQDKAYIDLPQENGKYDAGCYICDPQNPIPICFQMHLDAPAPLIDMNKALESIVHDLEGLKRNDGRLHLSELRAESESLKGQFPRFSQLPRIEELLNLSINGIHALYLELSTNADAKNKHSSEEPGVREASLLVKLQAIEAEEAELGLYVSRTRSANSGKDCRAAQMLIKPLDGQ